MLKDFSKLETFLTVVKEKSFSKASAKLGISQPAVTQQIKYIEEWLDTKIIERKKNGIKLTKDGEKLLGIVQKIERTLNGAEKEVMKIINKTQTLNIGASFTIGNHILPSFLHTIKDAIKADVFVKIDSSEVIIEQLLERKIDMALIESPVFKEGVVYREWAEEELVLFSNHELPKSVKQEELFRYAWFLHEWGSSMRTVIGESFEEIGVDCNLFECRGVVNSTTALKQLILKSPLPSEVERQTVGILSHFVIQDEVEKKTLFEARIKNCSFKRKLYLAYLKDKKNDPYVDIASGCIMGKKI